MLSLLLFYKVIVKTLRKRCSAVGINFSCLLCDFVTPEAA